MGRARLRLCVAMVAGSLAATVIAMPAGAQTAQEPIVFLASHPFLKADDDPREALLTAIARDLDEKKAGLKIEMRNAGPRAGAHGHWKALAKGELDLAMIPVDPLAVRFPRLSVVTLPGIANGELKGEQSGASPLMEAVRDELFRAGYVLVAKAFVANAFASTKDCIGGPSTVVGRRLRGIGASFEKTLEAAGARLSAVPLEEIYPGLQTGVLDGALLALDTIGSLRLHEQVRCVTIAGDDTPWLRFVPVVVVRRSFERLPPPQREALLAAGRRAEAAFRDAMRAREWVLLDTFRKADVKITALTAADVAAWVEVARASAYTAAIASAPESDTLIRLVRKAR